MTLVSHDVVAGELSTVAAVVAALVAAEVSVRDEDPLEEDPPGVMRRLRSRLSPRVFWFVMVSSVEAFPAGAWRLVKS